LLPKYSLLTFALNCIYIIANETLHTAKLKSVFKKNNTFGNKEIFDFYKNIDPLIKVTTVNWRVHHLVQSGVLSRVGRGKFIIGEGRNFVPLISSKIKRLYSTLHKQFPYLQLCIWNTSVLNELMQHQPGRFHILIEVEKDAMESVFFSVKENSSNVFLDPSAEILSRYASGQKETIIVKSLVSEAPMQNIQGVNTITIEKMLVDVFCDDTIFAAQQGGEMQHIFTNAFNRYTIHESRMLRYADRRAKKESFDNYLNKVSKFRQ